MVCDFGCEAKANTISNVADFKENIEGITEWKYRWPDGEITYRLNNLTPDIISSRHQERAITVALRVWQLRIKDIKFKREYNKDTSVDFDVSFRDQSVFSSPNVLAHAWFPGQGAISGDVEINDKWNWVTHTKISGIGNPPLVPIMIHEFGHSLGLRHDTTDHNSIMYPSFNLGLKKNDLSENDIRRIQGKEGFVGYGARTLSQRIIDMLKRRRDLGLDFR